ncbi:MAG: bifunctional 4-hydroxy-2-oxoglutarate aldolase/2-dehydro-3-deoxy-phosphogluconate aldolase [Cellvibrionaceae bacterium]
MITPAQSSNTILKSVETNITSTRVIPVLVIENAEYAADLAKVLVDSGLPILEVTLRTPAALNAMEAMAKVEGAIVAAGTVLNEQHVHECKSAGAEFLVSPGSTNNLIHSSAEADMPLLPGAATASEMMNLAEQGFHFLKFFPADINGGVAALKSFASPLSQLTFCPTGGVNTENLKDYLSLNNVSCAGGSWLVTKDDLKNKDWKGIAKKAKQLHLS